MSQLSVAKQRQQYGAQWGTANSEPDLQRIPPALDLITTRPLDGAHSEYHGLTSLLRFLLRDGC